MQFQAVILLYLSPVWFREGRGSQEYREWTCVLQSGQSVQSAWSSEGGDRCSRREGIGVNEWWYSLHHEGLNSIRYRRFCDKVSKPLRHRRRWTSKSTTNLSLRVYYQVMEWKDAYINMKPEDFWCNVADGRCLPIQTDQPATTSELLDVICCSCKKDCTTGRYTCRTYDLACTNVCRECRGVGYPDPQLPNLSDAYDDDGWVGPSPKVYQLQRSITVLTIVSCCVTFLLYSFYVMCRIYVECVTKVRCSDWTWKYLPALIILVYNFIQWNVSYISANIW